MSAYYHGSNFKDLHLEKIHVSPDSTEEHKLRLGPGFYLSKSIQSCHSYGVNIYSISFKKGFRIKHQRPLLKDIKIFLSDYLGEPNPDKVATKIFRDSKPFGMETTYMQIFENYVMGMGDYVDFCIKFSNFFEVDGIRVLSSENILLVLKPSLISLKPYHNPYEN